MEFKNWRVTRHNQIFYSLHIFLSFDARLDIYNGDFAVLALNYLKINLGHHCLLPCSLFNRF